MKYLTCLLLAGLLGCGTTRYQVGAGDPAAKASCSDCTATVHCTPDGHCVITCTDGSGAQCEIELACDGEHCTVVRSDCSPSCCTALASKAKQ